MCVVSVLGWGRDKVHNQKMEMVFRSQDLFSLFSSHLNSCRKSLTSWRSSSTMRCRPKMNWRISASTTHRAFLTGSDITNMS